ncbi:dihydroxyacetone kinase subunit L [Saccharomonospora sp. CUA-673]|uniref:dihydroxyacetone kinase subunit DhaL n=1 Tax=Saccharomonospora sp. CUA-673 TaxID=1904969 RepID=UPI00095E63CD|nr:dihydroxyacetone kinase subunit DhaL [Saccharomonospora sp. CUA-673]OLT45159.1 dihydroxyacetone kinase subunit L [Saccharomonospora sp. CUA-673]
MGCDAKRVAEVLRAGAATVADHKAELIDLDRAIGDADHGENLDRGFAAILSTLDSGVPETPGAVLKIAATTLISKVGGAAGPLYGTAFLRAATKLGDRSELDAEAVVAGLEAALEGVVARGKAEVGDATMVDALSPAVEAARQAHADGGDAAAVLGAAADAAKEGADSTVPLVARKGRASYLGERSVGHADPGATSTALLLRSFAETVS